MKENNCMPSSCIDNNWDKWIEDLHKNIIKSGYQKFNQNHRREDFSYWKNFKDDNNNKIYQIGVLVYDYRKFMTPEDYSCNRIGIAFNCLLFSEGRIEMEVSEDISLDKFEEMALSFYKTMSNHY
jgi:hypothetical protein